MNVPLFAPGFAVIPYVPSTDARLRRVKVVQGKWVSPYERAPGHLYVDGRLVGEAPSDAQVALLSRAPSDTLAGSATATIDGAYMVTTFLGFVARRGRVRAFPDVAMLGVTKDGSVLVSSVDQPPSQEAYQPDRVWFDRNGKRTDVGYADWAWLLPDGAVLGRAYRKPDGGYANEVNRPPEARAETFVWRRGVRTAIGTWWPMSVNAHGASLGFAANDPTVRVDRDRVGPLVRWEAGRLTPLDLGGRLGCEPLVARDDGSCVMGLVEGGVRRLGILRKGVLELVPLDIGGHSVDPRQVEVDERGRLFFIDRIDYKRHRHVYLQIVRAPLTSQKMRRTP